MVLEKKDGRANGEGGGLSCESVSPDERCRPEGLFFFLSFPFPSRWSEQGGGGNAVFVRASESIHFVAMVSSASLYIATKYNPDVTHFSTPLASSQVNTTSSLPQRRSLPVM